MKKLLIVLTALTLLLGCACAQAEGVLRVGMECAYAPYNWFLAEPNEFTAPVESGGYADGYDVQIAKRLAAALDKELVLYKIEWDGLPPALTSRMIDAIIAGMSPTPTRAMTLDFTDYYYLCDMVIVVRKDGAYANAASLSDFAGAKITGQLGTSHYGMIDQIPGVQKMTAMDTFPAMIVALQNNVIDGYLADRPGALSATTSNPDLTFVAFDEGAGFDVDLDEVSVSVGLEKGSPLLAPMNEALALISQQERDEMMAAAIARQPLGE